MDGNWRNVSKFRLPAGDRTISSRSAPSPLKTLSLDSLETGKEYYGRVNGVVKKDKLVRLYIKFGENGAFFERDGVVKGILHSGYHGRQFQKGDEVRVICHSTRPVELFLLPEYVRPLLILDINGVLGERSGFNQRNPSSSRSFRQRRHCREFLAMCSEHFELAVWSCSRRNNLELSIFSGIHLLFIWSQEESTSLYPRTSIVCEAKPLFLKELSKVWARYPSFNSSNTILLENHLEKFERNQFGSGILCVDCSGGIDDDELSPYSPLSSHLLTMAGQRPVDTQRYITEHAGSGPMFPLTYPVPPVPTNDASVHSDDAAAASSTNSLNEEFLSGVCPEPLRSCSEFRPPELSQNGGRSGSGRADSDMLMDYLMAACNQNRRVALQCIQQSALPGPKATPLHAIDVPQLVCPPLDGTPSHGTCDFCQRIRGPEGSRSNDSSVCVCCEYVVCEKTDGERAVLVASPTHGGELYLVHRNMIIQKLDVAETDTELQLQHEDDLTSWLQSMSGLTVLDGELVNKHDSADLAAFMVFDAVFVDGEFIGISPQHSLLSRLQKARTWIDTSALNRLHFAAVSCFQCKQFFPASQVSKVTCHFAEDAGALPPAAPGEGEVLSRQSSCSASSQWGWVYAFENDDTSQFPHLSDGLVFTPIRKNYYEYLAIKWKPPRMCTVDFLIQLSDLQKAMRSSRGVGTGYYVDGYVRSPGQKKESLLLLCQVHVDEEQAQDVLAVSPRGSSVVAECMFVPEKSGWFAVKLRADRAVPNSLRTAWSNMEVIAEGLTLDILTKMIGDASREARQVVRGSDGGVGNHYDRIQLQRQTGEKDDRIAMHRKVMNWAKACLLHLATNAQYRGLVRLPSAEDLHYHISTGHGGPVPDSEEMGEYEMRTHDAYSPASSPRTTAMSTRTGTGASGLDTYVLSTEGGGPLLDKKQLIRYLTTAAAQTGLLSDSSSIIPPDLRAHIPSHGLSASSNSGGRGRSGRGGRGGRGGSAPSINVLDVACGRGGDTKKFTSDRAVDLYVGVDVSSEQVKECGERVTANKRIKRSEMFLGDAAEGQWRRVTDAAPMFDIAWCMFALHYFCDTEAHCRALLSHVADSLKPGGKFIAAFPNPCSVYNNLSSDSGGLEKTLCSISPMNSSHPFTASLDDCLTAFGLEYRFTLGDAVEDCSEFVVPFLRVLDIASEYGLLVMPRNGVQQTETEDQRLDWTLSMHDCITEVCLEDSTLVGLRGPMAVTGPRSPGRGVSAEEWAAIGIYMSVIWEKC